MKLRKLELKDAPLMWEWMHDEEITKHLKTDFEKKTIEDCKSFIESDKGVHFAVTDETDEYLGTVSLKNLSDTSAEFAIALRGKALGTGIAEKAMDSVISYGFSELGLKRIYWCVDPNNTRAVRFYEKQGYSRTEAEDLSLDPSLLSEYSREETGKFLWYQVLHAE